MSELYLRIHEMLAGAPAALAAAQPALERWGLLVVLVMVLLEFVAGLGYFSQANTTLVAAGMIYGRAPLLMLACILIATAAATAGSYASRSLGRLGKFEGRRPQDSVLVRAIGSAVRRYTGPLAFAFHFSAWLRPIVPVVAGACGVRESRWLPWDIAGAAIWSTIMFFIGAYVRGMLYRSVSAADIIVLLVLTSLVGAAAVYSRRMLSGLEAQSQDC